MGQGYLPWEMAIMPQPDSSCIPQHSMPFRSQAHQTGTFVLEHAVRKPVPSRSPAIVLCTTQREALCMTFLIICLQYHMQ